MIQLTISMIQLTISFFAANSAIKSLYLSLLRVLQINLTNKRRTKEICSKERFGKRAHGRAMCAVRQLFS